MSSSSVKYANVWRLLHEYNFQIDMQEHGTLICCICRNLAKNAQRSSNCNCLYCLECVNSYVATDEKHCPGREGKCEALVVDLAKALRADDSANDRISEVSVPCPIDYCTFRDKLKRIGAHIESQHTSTGPVIHKGGIPVAASTNQSSQDTGTTQGTNQNKGPAAAADSVSAPHQTSGGVAATANHESREHALHREVEELREQLTRAQKESGVTETALKEMREELTGLKRVIEQYQSDLDAIRHKLEHTTEAPTALVGALHQTGSAANGVLSGSSGVRDARDNSEDWELELFSGDIDTDCLDVASGPPKRRRTTIGHEDDQETCSSLGLAEIRALITAEVARQTASLVEDRQSSTVGIVVDSIDSVELGNQRSCAPAPVPIPCSEDQDMIEQQPSAQTAVVHTDGDTTVDSPLQQQQDGRTPTNRRRLKRDLPRAIPIEESTKTVETEPSTATIVTAQGKVVPLAKSWPSSKEIAATAQGGVKAGDTLNRVHINTKPKQTVSDNIAGTVGVGGGAKSAVIHPVVLQRNKEAEAALEKSAASHRLSKARQQFQASGGDSVIATVSSGSAARRGARGGLHGNIGSGGKMTMMAMMRQEQQMQLARNRIGSSMVLDSGMGSPWQLQMLSPGRGGVGLTSGVPFELRVDRLADKLLQGRAVGVSGGTASVFSAPFYTSGPGAHDNPGPASRRAAAAASSPPGYRLCLRVDPVSPSGSGALSSTGAAGGYIGVFFRLVRGEHDDRLAWPMPLAVTVSLIDQMTLLPYTSRTFDHASAPETWKYVFQRPKADHQQQQHHGNSGGFWFGTSQFIHYDFLYNNPSLVKNDSIVIRCSTGL